MDCILPGSSVRGILELKACTGVGYHFLLRGSSQQIGAQVFFTTCHLGSLWGENTLLLTNTFIPTAKYEFITLINTTFLLGIAGFSVNGCCIERWCSLILFHILYADMIYHLQDTVPKLAVRTYYFIHPICNNGWASTIKLPIRSPQPGNHKPGLSRSE